MWFSQRTFQDLFYYLEVYLLNDTPGERKAISLVNCYVALLYSRHWNKALIEADAAADIISLSYINLKRITNCNVKKGLQRHFWLFS